MKLKEIPLNSITSKEINVSESNVFVPERVNASLNNSTLSVKSNSTTNNDTSVYPGGRDKNKLNFGFVAGKEYTLIGTVQIEEPLVGRLIKDALSITMIPVIDERPQWGYAISNSAPNVVGEYTLALDFKLPKEASAVWIRLSGGMLKNQGQVTWSNICFLEKTGEMGFYNHLTNYLSNTRLNNLVKIENCEVKIDQSLIEEYSISELNPSEIKEILEVVGNNKFRSSEVEKAQLFLKNATKYNLYDMPKILKDIFEKYHFDYKYFLNIHTNQAYQRFRTFIWLMNNFSNILNSSNYEINSGSDSGSDSQLPKYIFTYWNDGFENSPGIVQSAHNLLVKSVNKMKVVTLTDENIDFYIDVPDYVKKLKNRSIAHLSDFYRVALLNKYGGVWIDSTVMVGNNFEDKLLEMFSENGKSIITPRYGSEENLSNSQGISNWFIGVGDRHSRLISLQYNTLLLWLKDFDGFSYYYMFHAIWDFILCIDEESRSNWINSGFTSAFRSHIVQKHMFNLASDELINTLESNLVNKMTYKYDKSKNSSQSMLSYVGRLK